MKVLVIYDIHQTVFIIWLWKVTTFRTFPILKQFKQLRKKLTEASVGCLHCGDDYIVEIYRNAHADNSQCPDEPCFKRFVRTWLSHAGLALLSWDKPRLLMLRDFPPSTHTALRSAHHSALFDCTLPERREACPARISLRTVSRVLCLKLFFTAFHKRFAWNRSPDTAPLFRGSLSPCPDLGALLVAPCCVSCKRGFDLWLRNETCSNAVVICFAKNT